MDSFDIEPPPTPAAITLAFIAETSDEILEFLLFSYVVDRIAYIRAHSDQFLHPLKPVYACSHNHSPSNFVISASSTSFVVIPTCRNRMRPCLSINRVTGSVDESTLNAAAVPSSPMICV